MNTKSLSPMVLLAALALGGHAATAQAQTAPVVVELFTSQGCGACPAADAVLKEAAEASPAEGVQVIPLAWHVDYWNELGWKDPFSSTGATQHQRDYVERFKSGDRYTPQMVVDGRSEFVGRSKERLDEALRGAARHPKASVELSVAKAEGAPGMIVSVKATNVPPPAAERDAVQVVAYITEDNLTTIVSAGENAGQTLENSAVVREVVQLGAVTPGREFNVTTTIPLKPGWNPGELNVVVVLQVRISRTITGAATQPAP